MVGLAAENLPLLVEIDALAVEISALL